MSKSEENVIDVAATVWTDPSWLSWEAFLDTKYPIPNDNTTRLYETHQHACGRLAGDPNKDERIDAMTAFRRIVARRVKALIDTYQLRQLATGAKPKYDLELLEYFGIIRPFMLRRLIEIRNILEHEESDPPPVDECLMFADLVWYFLRSTDGLTKVQSDMVIFRPPHRTTSNNSQLKLSFQESFAELDVSALFHPSFISYEYKENWIKIEPAEVTRHKHGDETVWISVQGRVQGTHKQMKLIYDIYFGIS